MVYLYWMLHRDGYFHFKLPQQSTSNMCVFGCVCLCVCMLGSMILRVSLCQCVRVCMCLIVHVYMNACIYVSQETGIRTITHICAFLSLRIISVYFVILAPRIWLTKYKRDYIWEWIFLNFLKYFMYKIIHNSVLIVHQSFPSY